MSLDCSSNWGTVNAPYAQVDTAVVTQTPLSMSVFIKPFAYPIASAQMGVITIQGSGSSTNYFGVALNHDGSGGASGAPYFRARNSATFFALSPNTPVLNQWMHLGVRFAGINSGDIQGFENGSYTCIASGSISFQPQSLSLTQVGRDRAQSLSEVRRSFNGLIARVAIWDTTLTDGDFQLLGELIVPPTSIAQANLKAFYPGNVITIGGSQFLYDVKGNHALLTVGAVFDSDEPAREKVVASVVQTVEGGW